MTILNSYGGSSKNKLTFSLECNISHTTIKHTLLTTYVCLLRRAEKIINMVPFANNIQGFEHCHHGRCGARLGRY